MPTPQNTPETEIDFINLARTLWEGRKLLGKIMLLSLIAGLVVAYILPNKYTASCTFATQTADSESSLARLSSIAGLSGIATLAGANINIEIPVSMEISPQAYNEVIKSEPFQRELEQTSISLTNSQLNLVFDDYKGLATISCTMSDPKAAAQVCQSAMQILQNHLTKIFTGKAAANISYIQRRQDEAKKNHAKIEQEIANQAYQNKSKLDWKRLKPEGESLQSETQSFKSKTEQLQAEYELNSSVLTELAKELEHAKIRLQEETPHFSVIQPITIPTEKSSPNRPKILVYFAFAGFVLSFILIIGKTYLTDVRNKWHQTKTSIV